MDPTIYWQLLCADLVVTSKTVLRFGHFIGIALGLGAATLLDLMLLRFFIREAITKESWQIFHFFSKIVNWGLVCLWITGVGFIVHYALFDPEKLANEKIWAKLAIVWVLSLNGLFIHALVLPRIEGQIGKTLFAGMSRFQRSSFLVAGSISVVSWYMPLILAAFPQLNFSVPATTILLSYSALLAVVIITMHVIVRFMVPSRYNRTMASRAKNAAMPLSLWIASGMAGSGRQGQCCV